MFICDYIDDTVSSKILKFAEVQQRFTKCILELNKLPYEMRLKNLKTIETRRVWGDLIEPRGYRYTPILFTVSHPSV